MQRSPPHRQKPEVVANEECQLTLRRQQALGKLMQPVASSNSAEAWEFLEQAAALKRWLANATLRARAAKTCHIGCAWWCHAELTKVFERLATLVVKPESTQPKQAADASLSQIQELEAKEKELEAQLAKLQGEEKIHLEAKVQELWRMQQVAEQAVVAELQAAEASTSLSPQTRAHIANNRLHSPMEMARQKLGWSEKANVAEHSSGQAKAHIANNRSHSPKAMARQKLGWSEKANDVEHNSGLTAATSWDQWQQSAKGTQERCEKNQEAMNRLHKVLQAGDSNLVDDKAC